MHIVKRSQTVPYGLGGGPKTWAVHFSRKPDIPLLIIVTAAMAFLVLSPAWGVTVEELQQPIADLKNTIFGGWMWIAKIGAAVGGCVMAVYQRDIIPLATGAAVGLGIHFYDGYFGNPAAAALI